MNEKVSTPELAELLAEQARIPQKSAAAFIRIAFPLISEILLKEKYLKISGLGTFKLITVSSRESVNVSTGKRILIDSYNKITFTPDPGLRDKVNKPFQHFEAVELRDDVDFSAIDEEMGNAPEEEESIPSPAPEEAAKSAGTFPENMQDFSEKAEGLSEKDAAEEELTTEESADRILQVEETDEAEATALPHEKGEPGTEEAKPHPSREEEAAPEKTTLAASATEEPKASAPTVPAAGSRGEEERRESADTLGALALKSKEEYEKEDPAKRFSLVISVKHCFALSLLIIAFLIYICVWKPAWLFDCDFSTEAPPAARNEQPASPQSVDRTPVEKAKPMPAAQPRADRPKKPEERIWITARHADPSDYKIIGALDTVTVGPGNSLTKYALEYYGCMDLWPLIATHNKETLRNPDNLLMGTTIVIPRLGKK